jgi:hypothetical protein
VVTGTGNFTLASLPAGYPVFLRQGNSAGDPYAGLRVRWPNIKLVQDGRLGDSLVQRDNNDFAARIGIAWNPDRLLARGRGSPGRFRLPEWHFVPRIFMKGGIGGKNRQCYRRARDLVAGHSGLSTPSDVFSQIDRQNFERMYRIFRDRFKSGRVLESVRAAATNSCVWRPSSKSLIPINQGSVFRRSP